MSNSLSLATFTLDKLPQLADLKLGFPTSKREQNLLIRQLAQPNIDPERDCFFVLDESLPVGYFLLIQETLLSRGVLEYSVIDVPERNRITRFLLDAASKIAADSDLKILHVDVPESSQYLENFNANPQWEHIRTHLHLVTNVREFPEVEIPGNLNLRIANKEDAAVVTSIQNQAFQGSWGYCPNTVAEIEYRIFDLPEYKPDRVLILEQNTEAVGYCWTHVDSIKNSGIIGMIGVIPSYQGNGFGKILLSSGLSHLQASGLDCFEITVDSENPSAIHVYQKAGFTLDWKSFWYERKPGG